jgi:hypothetical protein
LLQEKWQKSIETKDISILNQIYTSIPTSNKRNFVYVNKVLVLRIAKKKETNTGNGKPAVIPFSSQVFSKNEKRSAPHHNSVGLGFNLWRMVSQFPFEHGFLANQQVDEWCKLKRVKFFEWGMGNGEWGMGNGEWGMGNRDFI